METQTSEEFNETELAPSKTEESATQCQVNPPPDVNGDPEESSKLDLDQAENPTIGHQAKQQSKAKKIKTVTKPAVSNILNFPFPIKLWMITEDEAFMSIYWNDDGDAVVIKENLFQKEILHRTGESKIFQADDLKGFIKLLNMHGFRRTHSKTPSGRCSRNRRTILYRNSKFKRDHPSLVQNIQKRRRRKTKMTTDSKTTTPAPKRRKQMEAITFHQLQDQTASTESTESMEEKTLPEVPSLEGPSSCQPMCSPEVCLVSSSAQCPQKKYSKKQDDPNMEVVSRNASSIPLPTASRRRPRQNSSRYRAYRDYNTTVSLYNTCYSLLRSALSACQPPRAMHDNTSQYPSASDQLEENSEV